MSAALSGVRWCSLSPTQQLQEQLATPAGKVAEGVNVSPQIRRELMAEQKLEEARAEAREELPKDLRDYDYYLSRDTYVNTTCEIEDALSLFPEVYMDDNFFRLENERVFKKSWVCVGHSDQLRNDGDALSIKLGKIPLLLTNHKGNIHAFYNVCRHRGSILLKEGITLTFPKFWFFFTNNTKKKHK